MPLIYRLLSGNLYAASTKFKNGKTALGTMFAISGPQWFYGLDYYFEIIAFLITFIISIYSMRIFFLTWERKYLYFTLAFLSIAGSFAIRAPMDWFIYRNLLPNVPNVANAVSILLTPPELHGLAILLSILFLLSGFLLLAALYLGVKDPKMIIGLEALLILIVVFQGFLFRTIEDFIVIAHIFMIVMLVMIVFHQYHHFRKRRSTNSLLVFIALASLLLAHLSYLLIPYLNENLYGVGHGLQLLGYVMLLVNMVLVFKK
jgi:hypothetical protein